MKGILCNKNYLPLKLLSGLLLASSLFALLLPASDASAAVTGGSFNFNQYLQGNTGSTNGLASPSLSLGVLNTRSMMYVAPNSPSNIASLSLASVSQFSLNIQDNSDIVRIAYDLQFNFRNVAAPPGSCNTTFPAITWTISGSSFASPTTAALTNNTLGNNCYPNGDASWRINHYLPAGQTSENFTVSFSQDLIQRQIYNINGIQRTFYWQAGVVNIMTYYADGSIDYSNQLKEINNNISNLGNKLDGLTQAQRDQNQLQQEQNDWLKDDTLPDVDTSVLGNTLGWLPPGPVDTLLTTPLVLLNGLVGAFSSTVCTPVNLPLPYVGENIQLPCMRPVIDAMGGTLIFNVVGFIISAIVLFSFFKFVYKWVDDTLTFRENNSGLWGGF